MRTARQEIRAREINGTSAAAPHVAAGASLLLSANPKLMQAEVRSILTKTAARLPGQTGWSDELGYAGSIKNLGKTLHLFEHFMNSETSKPRVPPSGRGPSMVASRTSSLRKLRRQGRWGRVGAGRRDGYGERACTSGLQLGE